MKPDAFPPSRAIPRAYGPWDGRQQSRERYVFCDDDMRRVLTELADFNGSPVVGADGGRFGWTIVIAAALYPASKYTIPKNTNGVRIRSAGRTPIIPSGILPTVFEVHARAVTFSELLVDARGTTNYAQTFIATAGDNARNMLIEGCIVNADRFFVDTGGTADGVKIIANEIAAVTADATPMIESASLQGLVLGNRINPVAARSGVTLDAGARAWRIVGNHFFVNAVAASIDTSASLGANRLAANSGASSKSLAATDIDDDADPGRGSYAPGSFSLLTGKFAVMSNHLQLTGTQRFTGSGTSRLRIT